MKCYHFQNFYLSGEQAGIQSYHSLGEMVSKYLSVDSRGSQGSILLDWLNNHKTVIVLNGGMQSSLESLVELFESEENHLPWAKFNESQEALGGALTNVGIVVPDKIYGLRPFAEQISKVVNKKGETIHNEFCYKDERISIRHTENSLISITIGEEGTYNLSRFELSLALIIATSRLM